MALASFHLSGPELASTPSFLQSCAEVVNAYKYISRIKDLFIKKQVFSFR
jgi:hypothetical protein